jgi:hypothetical protein
MLREKSAPKKVLALLLNLLARWKPATGIELKPANFLVEEIKLLRFLAFLQLIFLIRNIKIVLEK